MNGELIYGVRGGSGGVIPLRLSLVQFKNSSRLSLADQRRAILIRVAQQASRQGGRLKYSDLSVIMLASSATIKRDVNYLRSMGIDVPVGRRANAMERPV